MPYNTDTDRRTYCDFAVANLSRRIRELRERGEYVSSEEIEYAYEIIKEMMNRHEPQPIYDHVRIIREEQKRQEEKKKKKVSKVVSHEYRERRKHERRSHMNMQAKRKNR
jgi:hypothetical protein